MAAPTAQLLCDQRIVSAKKHELHFFADAQALPIRAFQCRAGQRSVLARFNALSNQVAQILQPRPSVLIRQRNTATHFVDIGLQMKIVCLIETPAKFLREQFANGSFSCSRDAEKNYDHRELICFLFPIFSTRNATKTKSV